MTSSILLLTKILSLFTIVGGLIVVDIIVLLLAKKVWKQNRLIDWGLNLYGRHGLLLAFGVALFATVSSLFFSNIPEFVPCALCWWQRIFLYPQVVILGLALWKKDVGISLYGIALSIIGGVIAIYHTYLQFGGSPIIPCSANVAASCAQRYFLEFGYVTIPTMALTSFVLIALLLYSHKRYSS